MAILSPEKEVLQQLLAQQKNNVSEDVQLKGSFGMPGSLKMPSVPEYSIGRPFIDFYQDMRNRHNKFQTKYAQGGSTFTVEATMPSNQERFYGVILDENRLYKEYDFTAPWETVERDIRQFYKTGKGPSITQQFHR